MEVTFWGVRGSIPAPGPGTVRYGGNTACVSVRLQSGDLLIFDLGTGARNLGNALLEGPFGKGQGQATVLLSLTQWDHIQGFPFFTPFYVAGNQFTVYGGTNHTTELEAILEKQMAAQYFPVQTYRNMPAAITLQALPVENTFKVGSATITAVRQDPGPLGATTYRIEDAGKCLAYTGHGAYQPGDPRSALMKDVDVLIHECSFSHEDWVRYPDRGLSSVDQAVNCATAAGAAKLVLFHYDQDYSDAEVDALLARAQHLAKEQGGDLQIAAAAERQTLTV